MLKYDETADFLCYSVSRRKRKRLGKVEFLFLKIQDILLLILTYRFLKISRAR